MSAGLAGPSGLTRLTGCPAGTGCATGPALAALARRSARAGRAALATRATLATVTAGTALTASAALAPGAASTTLTAFAALSALTGLTGLTGLARGSVGAVLPVGSGRTVGPVGAGPARGRIGAGSAVVAVAVAVTRDDGFEPGAAVATVVALVGCVARQRLDHRAEQRRATGGGEQGVGLSGGYDRRRDDRCRQKRASHRAQAEHLAMLTQVGAVRPVAPSGVVLTSHRSASR